jgi:hypothetical protein
MGSDFDQKDHSRRIVGGHLIAAAILLRFVQRLLAVLGCDVPFIMQRIRIEPLENILEPQDNPLAR